MSRRNDLRVVLVDDQEFFRKGIASLLAGIEGMTVVGEAGDGQEALRLVARLKPDLVLLDLGLPGLVGIEVARRLRAELPKVKIIILSRFSDEEHVARALELGVSGYLLKSSSAEELEIAVLAAARGDTYLTPAVSGRIVHRYLHHHSSQVAEPLAALTSRQRQILQLIAEGHSTRQIAAELHLSIKTIESHRANIMDRLEIRDIPGLVRLAVRAGLVDANH